MKDYIVTVMAQDRVGIVRDVSTALVSLDGNITHLSQTVMRGYFTLIISVQVPDEYALPEIRSAVESRGGEGEFEVGVRPYEDPKVAASRPSERFTLSMQGRDQKGTIARVTTYLAEREVNIDDFSCWVHDGMFLMLAQVSVPISVDVDELRSGLERVGAEFDTVVHFQHENIFRAAGDVRPVMHLHCSK